MRAPSLPDLARACGYSAGYFSRVLVPSAVMDELSHPHTPTLVKDWFLSTPAWLSVEQQAEPALLKLPANLHRVSRKLAASRKASVVLLDDFDARRAAQGVSHKQLTIRSQPPASSLWTIARNAN